MVGKDPQKEELQRAVQGEQRDEGAAPDRTREALDDLDVTESEGGAVKGGIPRQNTGCGEPT